MALACLLGVRGAAAQRAPAATTGQESPIRDRTRPQAQSGLRGLLAAGTIPEARAVNGLGANCHAPFATSYLPAPGAAPAKPVPPFPENDTAGADEAYAARFIQWACQYAPQKAFDGDTSTAWVEGAGGDGAGEVLIVPVDASCRTCPDLRRAPGGLEIWAGHGKSPALHRANARPREIRVYLLLAEAVDNGEDMVSSVVIHRNARVVGTRQVVLEDRDGYQPLPLPPVPAGEHFLIGIEVLSVYPGARWQDLAITEVRQR